MPTIEHEFILKYYITYVEIIIMFFRLHNVLVLALLPQFGWDRTGWLPGLRDVEEKKITTTKGPSRRLRHK